jgi:hypothetical protein
LLGALVLSPLFSGCMAVPLVAAGATVVGASGAITTEDVNYTPATSPDDLSASVRAKSRLTLLSAGGAEAEAGRLLEEAGYAVTIDQSQGNQSQQTQMGRTSALAAACGRGSAGPTATVIVRLIEMKDESGLRIYIARRSGSMQVGVDVMNCRTQRVSTFTGSQKISGGIFQADNFNPQKMAGALGASRLIALSKGT